MNIKLSKEKVRNLINQYYRDIYGIEGKTCIQVSKAYVGYGMGEHKDCVVDIKYKGKTKILGEESPISIDVFDNDLETIIKYYLEQEGYSVTYFSIDKGLDYKTEGYGMGEHTESYPYFRGIEVNITGKEKIKEKENERYKGFKI